MAVSTIKNVDRIYANSYLYSGASTSAITFTDDNAPVGFCVMTPQDAGRPIVRYTRSGNTFTVYLWEAVTLTRINYIIAY